MMKNSWIFFVFLIIVISGLGSAFSGLIIPLLIFYIIYKATTKNNAQKNTRRRSSPQRQPRSRLSARQSEAVNEALTRSFDPALHAKAMDVLRGVQIDVLGGGGADAH